AARGPRRDRAPRRAARALRAAGDRAVRLRQQPPLPRLRHQPPPPRPRRPRGGPM
ncbi:MAG: hypothetical protein AVDCRST_MAG35-1654, partial [uncultured Quadrisphaera sp.]